MATLGFDSEIIYHIHQERSGTISHLRYIIPTLKTFLRHNAPTISLCVNGKEVLSEKRGYLIISNTKQYALGIPFSTEARSEDCSLIIKFFPYSVKLGAIFLCLKAIFGFGKKLEFKGEKMLIRTPGYSPYPVQCDGEYIRHTPVEICIDDTSTINILQCA